MGRDNLDNAKHPGFGQSAGSSAKRLFSNDWKNFSRVSPRLENRWRSERALLERHPWFRHFNCKDIRPGNRERISVCPKDSRLVYACPLEWRDRGKHLPAPFGILPGQNNGGKETGVVPHEVVFPGRRANRADQTAFPAVLHKPLHGIRYLGKAFAP